MAPAQIGRIGYPVRVREGYAQDLLGRDRRRSDHDARDFRLLVDYGGSAASFVLPLVLGPLGIETVSLHEFAEADADSVTLPESLAQAERLVRDGRRGLRRGARPIRRTAVPRRRERESRSTPDQATLLYVALLVRLGARGRVAFPGTVTGAVDRLTQESRLEVVRTAASLAELSQAADEDGAIFAAAGGGAYIVPRFQPAADGVAALAFLLELLSKESRPLSEIVGRAARRRMSCTDRSPCSVGARRGSPCAC